MSCSTSRRSFVRTAALGSAALVAAPRLFSQPAALAKKPNLLVFLPDQLRADAVVGPAAAQVHAPNLQKLASQSVVMERAYVAQPVCVPSRSALMSGTWPHVNGAVDVKSTLALQYKCLPEMLGDTDYRTGYFGKWHLGDENSPQRGFQEWISTEEYEKGVTSGDKVRGQSDYTSFLISKGYKPEPKNGRIFDRNMVTNLPFELSKPKFLETHASDFLEKHKNDPFILFVAFYEPHPPYNGPFNKEHALDSFSVDPTSDDVFGDDVPLRYRLLQERFREQTSDPAKLKKIKQRYLGLIYEIDRCIGAILAKLESLGLPDRTSVVMTSDHGDMMGAHRLLGKTVMFEQSARVPCIWRIPGQRAFQYRHPTSHIDFAPTILELLGKSAPAQCAGRSRLSLIRGENAAPEPIFAEWCRPMENATRKSKLATKEQTKEAFAESTRTVITPDGWKLSLRDKDKNELYNLKNDPDERHNLFASAAKEKIFGLTGEIHRWQEKTGDPLKL
jgi:arylsulfatase A-like enzyme